MREHHHVFFEGTINKTIGEIMSELRFWLDTNKIFTSGFSYEVARSGAIEAHLTFESRYHAELFEQAFCGAGARPRASRSKGGHDLTTEATYGHGSRNRQTR